ncbi:MAG: biotin/lipoyl-binding protein, partial [Myxococcota bacterium]
MGSLRMSGRLWIPLFATSLWLAACGGGDEALLGTLERDRIELVSETQQTIVEVAVREGESVAHGQLLLRIDASAAEARLAQARSIA